MCCVRDLYSYLQFYISSFLAVFLTVLVTSPQQRWSQVFAFPQPATGVADSQEQQVREGPPKP